jgi:glycosyltransferase involved in cell wall biosynthesis
MKYMCVFYVVVRKIFKKALYPKSNSPLRSACNRIMNTQMDKKKNEYDITFVLPVYNEEQYLESTLKSLAKQELGPYKAEILIIDGYSTDRSFEIAKAYESNDDICFRTMKNEKRIAAAALNIGVREAKSGIVGFGGSHAIYPTDYLRLAVELIIVKQHDAVGGWCNFISTGSGIMDRTMVLLYTSPLGAGARRDYYKTEPTFVKTVFGGLFRREIIEQCGGYDEDLSRGQDIDFNLRIRAAGYKILFHPGLNVNYMIKTDPKIFFKRAFITSSAIAEIFNKRGRSPGFHYLVPLGFLVYIIFLLPLVTFGGWGHMLFIPLIIYFALQIVSAVKLITKASVLPGLLTIPIFFAYHIVYGTGVFYGYVKYYFSDLFKKKLFKSNDSS